MAFIEALAECACVAEACARVGMSVASAYALRRRLDAGSFRQAWEAALDHAVERLSDAVFARAIHGVARPVFFQGQQVGERRHYDERLAMFLLRYRDPVRYGAWIDRCEAHRHPEGPALALGLGIDRVALDAAREEAGIGPRTRPPLAPRRFVDATERAEKEEHAAARRAEAEQRAEDERRRRDAERWMADGPEDDGEAEDREGAEDGFVGPAGDRAHDTGDRDDGDTDDNTDLGAGEGAGDGAGDLADDATGAVRGGGCARPGRRAAEKEGNVPSTSSTSAGGAGGRPGRDGARGPGRDGVRIRDVPPGGPWGSPRVWRGGP